MIQLIKAATLGVSKEQRIIAEQQIIQLRLQKTQNFFVEACSVFQNEQLPSNIRQASGTIIDMSILVQTQPQNYLWDNLSANTKQNVKDAVLSVLIDHDRNIRRAAANIVAAICCIEIPRNQWDGIIEKISSNINNEDLLIKQVSILTLGFICERLKDKKSFIFSAVLQEQILTGILLGLKETQRQIVETSLKALRDGVGSMADILNNPQYRDYLINQTVQIINKQEYKNYGLQILSQFARVCYQYLDNYMNGFITLLQPIIKNTKDEDNCIQAIQFWQSISTQYKIQIDGQINTKNYITGQNGSKVVSWLLEDLCAIQQDDDNQENGVADAAAKCLQVIFEDDSQQFQTLVLNFTSNTIKHQSWKYRQASIRAFASFLIGVNDQRKQQLVDASLLQLVALLNDQSKTVQYSAIKSINLITEECAQSFLHHQNFIDILKLVVGKLTVSPSFLSNGCKIIDNLCQVCKQTGEIYFTSLAQDLIQVLFDICLTNDSTLHIINCCICTIMNLITASHNSQVCKKQIHFVINHFDDINKLQTEKRQTLFSSFFTIIQVALIALRKQPQVSMETLSIIYQLVIKHFQNIKRVDSDGLYVIGSLSFYFREDPRLIDDFWKFIQHSLTQYDQSHTFKAGMSCVCDFAANYRQMLGDKIPLLMNHLHEAFQKPQVSRQSKLDVIMCIGQLYLNCGTLCIKFLDETMRLLIVACEASVTMNITDRGYAENLREYILDTLTCILHGLNFDQTQPCKQLLPSIQSVFRFIQVTTEKVLQPKINYVKSCILWMADVSRFYKTHVQKLVRQKWVYDCLQMLKKHNKNHSLDGTIQYAKENF